MRGSRGDVMIGFLIVVGTVIGALAAAPVLDFGDGIATRMALYASAVAAGVYLWRRLVRPVLQAVDVILGLDGRVASIEKHLGIHKDT